MTHSQKHSIDILMKSTQLELSYQRDEKKRMKEEATYALNKGELSAREYEKLILKIIDGHKDIVQEILSDKK